MCIYGRQEKKGRVSFFTNRATQEYRDQLKAQVSKVAEQVRFFFFIVTKPRLKQANQQQYSNLYIGEAACAQRAQGRPRRVEAHREANVKGQVQVHRKGSAEHHRQVHRQH